MKQPILFISDLHLEESRPDITANLLYFLREHAGKCHSLFILGDLFEVWIGDDESTALTQEVATALHSFQAQGSSVFLLHGNRDFLMGSAYAEQCGATLIEEPYVLETDNGKHLLVHGDSLCTDDVDYMKFRDMVRNPQWQQEFLSQSLSARREFADQARQQSQAATAGKAMDIMDVNQQAVEELLHTSQMTSLIHGHTHRPKVHDIQLDSPINEQQRALRLVLGDWDKSGWYAELVENKLSLHQFPLQEVVA